MGRDELDRVAQQGIMLLLRSYGLFLLWCVLGLLIAGRFLLLPIGGLLLIISTIGGMFWFAIGVWTLSFHCIMLAFSCGFVGLLGMVLCGLATGTFLNGLRKAAALSRTQQTGQVEIINSNVQRPGF